jgi:DNA mismatch repair protein MutL
MSRINVLDEKTAGQIAAGEVIERPAGVLKELLENAIDAGASSVHITIEGGGKTLLRINDNGCGMTREDLELSVLRHATSKIRTFDDLDGLQTFGFRGEALYSVAAVSRMTITSCTEGGDGNRLEIHGGKVLSVSPAPAIKGTTVEIRDLFYNVPARLKFLKSDSSEKSALLKVIEESALSNLQVGFHVTVHGREVYNLPAETGEFQQAVLARVGRILGDEIANSLVFHETTQMGLRVFVSPTDKLLTSRDYQYIFVNRRPIDSKTVQQAVYKAYQNARPKDRHPAFLVYMTLEPSAFDVNIHPQKRDIRFAEEHEVFRFLLQTIGETIFSNGRPVEVELPSAPSVSLLPSAQAAATQLFTPAVLQKMPMEIFAETYGYLSVEESEQPAPVVPVLITQSEEDITPAPVVELRETDQWSVSQPSAGETMPPADLAAFSYDEIPLEPSVPHWYHGPYRYLGQLQRSYLLFENPQGLVIIDQHAAQERVLFEKYLDEFEKREVQVEKLLFPIHVDLPPSNVEKLLSWAEWLKKVGFEIEPFSPQTVLVRTMPHVVRFKEADMKNFIVSLAQTADENTQTTDALKRKMVALLSCKRAVKAHDALSAPEAEALLENMKNCKDGMHCPHGRPVLAELGISKIDKLFGR